MGRWKGPGARGGAGRGGVRTGAWLLCTPWTRALLHADRWPALLQAGFCTQHMFSVAQSTALREASGALLCCRPYHLLSLAACPPTCFLHANQGSPLGGVSALQGCSCQVVFAIFSSRQRPSLGFRHLRRGDSPDVS